MNQIEITQYEYMAAVYAYNNAHRSRTWVIQKDTGTAAQLISLESGRAIIKIANGDEYAVPTSEIYMRGAL